MVDRLGLEPRNLRVAAGLGLLGWIRELAGTPQAGAHRGFYALMVAFLPGGLQTTPSRYSMRRSSGRPRANASMPCPYSWSSAPGWTPTLTAGTALTWAAARGRVEAIRRLLDLGADPNTRGTFGGPSHGEGVTALHLEAQNGHVDAVRALLASGADSKIRDLLHGSPSWGWAEYGGHQALAELLLLA